MSTIGSMAVNVVARTMGFDTKIKKSRKELKRFGNSAHEVRRGLASFGKGLLAVGGVAISGAFVKSQMDMLDNLGKQSDKLGISTEALGAYREQANLAGVSTTALDTSLQRMARRVAEAGAGTGEAVKALKALRLDAKKLAAEDTAKQFSQIAAAIGDLNKEGDKIRFAQKIFDTEGVGLVNMFNTNMEQAVRNYKAMGKAVSAKEIDRIEEFNDSLAKMSNRLKGTTQGLIIDVTPVAMEAIKGLEAVLENVGLLRSNQRESRQTGMAGRLNRGRRGAVDLIGEFYGALTTGQLPADATARQRIGGAASDFLTGGVAPFVSQGTLLNATNAGFNAAGGMMGMGMSGMMARRALASGQQTVVIEAGAD